MVTEFPFRFQPKKLTTVAEGGYNFTMTLNEDATEAVLWILEMMRRPGTWECRFVYRPEESEANPAP